MNDLLVIFVGLYGLVIVWGWVQKWTAPHGNTNIYQYRLEIAKMQLMKEKEKTKKVKVQLKIEQEKTKRVEMHQIKNEVVSDEN